VIVINIEIKNNVKEYLNQKNIQDIHIEMENRGGCCSGPVYIPVVKLGKPDFGNTYDLYMQDKIAFYLPKNVKKEEVKKITIKLKNFLGRKSLSVNGLLAYKESTWTGKKY